MLNDHKQWPIVLPYHTVLNYYIILILQCLLLYSILQLDSVLRTELLLSKGEFQSLLPYLFYQWGIRGK